MPTVGDKLRIIVPVTGDLDVRPIAVEELERCAQRHGLTATDVRLVSSGPWDEEICGVGPHPDVTLHTYEATAA